MHTFACPNRKLFNAYAHVHSSMHVLASEPHTAHRYLRTCATTCHHSVETTCQHVITAPKYHVNMSTQSHCGLLPKADFDKVCLLVKALSDAPGLLFQLCMARQSVRQLFLDTLQLLSVLHCLSAQCGEVCRQDGNLRLHVRQFLQFDFQALDLYHTLESNRMHTCWSVSKYQCLYVMRLRNSF